MIQWAERVNLLLHVYICTQQVVLSREDQAMYAGWEYSCVNDFQQEVVDFLTFRDGDKAGFDAHGGGCCSVS